MVGRQTFWLESTLPTDSGSGARRAARQHSDLTAAPRRTDPGPADPATRTVVLALLTIDGVISAVTGALLLPIYLGTVPFPISALITGLVNAALVWAAMYWTDSKRLAALPLWAWLVTVAGLSLGGPGGDVVFGGPGIMGYSVLIFLIVGVVPPAWLLWRRADPPG